VNTILQSFITFVYHLPLFTYSFSVSDKTKTSGSNRSSNFGAFGNRFGSTQGAPRFNFRFPNTKPMIRISPGRARGVPSMLRTYYRMHHLFVKMVSNMVQVHVAVFSYSSGITKPTRTQKS